MEPIYFNVGETEWFVEQTPEGNWRIVCDMLEIDEEAETFEDLFPELMDVLRNRIEEAFEDSY